MNNYQTNKERISQSQIIDNEIFLDESLNFNKDDLEKNIEKRRLKDLVKNNRKIKLSKALRDNLKRRK